MQILSLELQRRAHAWCVPHGRETARECATPNRTRGTHIISRNTPLCSDAVAAIKAASSGEVVVKILRWRCEDLVIVCGGGGQLYASCVAVVVCCVSYVQS